MKKDKIWATVQSDGLTAQATKVLRNLPDMAGNRPKQTPKVMGKVTGKVTGKPKVTVKKPVATAKRSGVTTVKRSGKPDFLDLVARKMKVLRDNDIPFTNEEVCQATVQELGQ